MDGPCGATSRRCGRSHTAALPRLTQPASSLPCARPPPTGDVTSLHLLAHILTLDVISPTLTRSHHYVSGRFSLHLRYFNPNAKGQFTGTHACLIEQKAIIVALTRLHRHTRCRFTTHTPSSLDIMHLHYLHVRHLTQNIMVRPQTPLLHI